MGKWLRVPLRPHWTIDLESAHTHVQMIMDMEAIHTPLTIPIHASIQQSIHSSIQPLIHPSIHLPTQQDWACPVLFT